MVCTGGVKLHFACFDEVACIYRWCEADQQWIVFWLFHFAVFPVAGQTVCHGHEALLTDAMIRVVVFIHLVVGIIA